MKLIEKGVSDVWNCITTALHSRAPMSTLLRELSRGSLQEIAEGGNVSLSHLESFELGEFVVGADGRDYLSEFVKGFVKAAHSSTFTSVGG